MPRKKGFVVRYETIWRGLTKMGLFTDKEKVVLADLSSYLSYENAIAGRDGPMSTLDMANALCMDDSNLRKILRSLMRKNAIGTFESGDKRTYYMNPELYCKGEPKKWLEQQFSHKATCEWAKGSTIVNIEKFRTTLIRPPDGLIEEQHKHKTLRSKA